MTQAKMDEDFLLFESKVNQVLRLLEEMGSTTKGDNEGAGRAEPPKPLVYDEEKCIVTVRENTTTINKRTEVPEVTDPLDKSQINKFTFMRQIEEDAEQRAKVRQEREKLAQNFRTLGNEAYRKFQYEKAILLYTKAIDHVKDSPILYNNRALSFIKLKNYKRGIADCDYVLNKLDEKNLRSWLYRAAGFKRLGDEKNYENSINLAKKNNSKEWGFIANFVEKLKSEF